MNTINSLSLKEKKFFLIFKKGTYEGRLNFLTFLLSRLIVVYFVMIRSALRQINRSLVISGCVAASLALLLPSTGGGHVAVIVQTLTYLSRPHWGIPTGPIVGPSVWTGAELAERTDEWRQKLSSAELTSLNEMVRFASSTGKPLDDLTAGDCPLGVLSNSVPRWRNATDPVQGLGFVVIKGLPVAEWNDSEAGVAFWCIGRHLGHAGAQNGRGELLGAIRDEFGGTPPARAVRQYRTNEAIDFHTDAADVVALFCLSQGDAGGSSRLASTGAIYNAVAAADTPAATSLFGKCVFARFHSSVYYERSYVALINKHFFLRCDECIF